MKVTIEFELDPNFWGDYTDISDEILLDDLTDGCFCCGVLSATIKDREGI